MKKFLLTLLAAAPILGFSQWSKVESVSQRKATAQHEGKSYSTFFDLNIEKLKSQLSSTAKRSSHQKGTLITLPNTQGNLEQFEVWEHSNMSPALQEKHPDIRSYVGRSLSDPSAYLRFSVSPQGVSSMVIRSGTSEYIEPFTADKKTYVVFDSSQKRKDASEEFICNAIGEAEEVTDADINSKAIGSKTFRLALSCTGEYGSWHLTQAGIPSSATDEEKKAAILAAFNATLTRLNGVYEKDLAVHYNLIDETESLIFYNAATDPYTSGGPNYANTGINATLGDDSASLFDLGHLMDRESANGAAYLGVVCNPSYKAGGWTAHLVPVGATYDIDYVAHEMGHQMGAGHTYTFYSGQLDQKVEPGSGSTIMAYTGIVGNLDVQYNSHDNYHYSSLAQIKSRMNAVSCGENVPFELPAPTLNAGADYTIPKSTPFKVSATTSDTDTNAYTYSFEQIDQAATAQIGNNSVAYPTKPTGPNFRAFAPTSEPYRYFPEFYKVLTGALSTRWESVSSVGRNLNFGVVLRNNNPTEPNIATDAMKVTVNADAGPFAVTAPTFGEGLVSGENFEVKWDVASTDVAPVNTQNVTIKLSTDGGSTFTTIAENTPNDGSEVVTIPLNSTSENSFILIEAVDNIYYAVSPSFVIDYTVDGETCATYTTTGTAVAINDGLGGSGISSPKVEFPLEIADEGVITKVTVHPNITHGNVGQLSFGVESPVGTSALLMHHQCSTSGIDATFTDDSTTATCSSPISGERKPFESLSVFKGLNAAGTWKLFASDNNLGVVGTINSWALEVCTRSTETLGVNNANVLSNDIKIYPNPSDGNFFVKTKELTGKVETSIFDMSGKLVHQSSSTQSGEQTTKSYQLQLPKGVYVVHVKSNEGSYSQKLIIK